MPAKKPTNKKPAQKKTAAKKPAQKKPTPKKIEAENDTLILEDGLSTIPVEDEISKSFLDYAMSVIVSRALPDVKDGLNQFKEEFYIQCMKQELDQQVHLENVLRL